MFKVFAILAAVIAVDAVTRINTKAHVVPLQTRIAIPPGAKNEDGVRNIF